jgi:hypothetical protein
LMLVDLAHGRSADRQSCIIYLIILPYSIDPPHLRLWRFPSSAIFG